MMINSEKQFGYGYLPGSHLLQTLTMPCNMTLTQSYESQRDILIGMAYHRSTTLVTQRSYSYDALGRLLTRSTNRNGQTVNDSFVHNSRSELISATVNGTTYGYDYDNIGNRNTATEGEEVTAYAANELNQYTAVADFAPTFDADGNQTLVKTATGIWSVEYNAENRPVRFTSADSSSVIECSYDTHGRRATKKVTTNGSVTLHQRYIYRGYLQIAACDLTRSGHPCLWLLTWDPSQPIATRPLAIRKDGTWYAYGWDLTKNICEVFGQHGYLRTAYAYSPYGQIETSGNVTQPIQWSSEYLDTELGLIYYNYRHYNPMDGRWIGRDRIGERDDFLLYKMVGNNPIHNMDVIGNAGYAKIACCVIAAALSIWNTYDTLSGELCVGETGSDYVKCMLANAITSALGSSSLVAVTCCVLRNLEKGDVDGARQCVQDEIEGILRDFLHITALTCCIGPSALMGIGRTIVNGALQSVRNTSPKPCCP